MFHINKANSQVFCKMLSKFIFVWYLLYLYFETSVGHPLQYPLELSDENQCNFNVSQIYNVTDLLKCMNALFVVDGFSQDDSRSLRQRNQFDSLIQNINPYGFSYENLISSLFNNNQASPANHDFPLDPSNYYQSDQLGIDRPLNQFNGFGINLFDALSSISRYDDLKCVPRILCEAANGRLTGQYKQASTYLGEFGRNTFIQWLGGFDLAATSPILNFARAAVLGYSSKGDPTMCYRTFPKCPRNPDKLVHYLNNHNGGFFRFFNRGKHESYPQSQSLYTLRGNTKNRRRAPPPGYNRLETDRTGTGKLKFDISIPNIRQDYGESFFSKKTTLENSRRIVFPTHDKSTDESPKNRIPKSLSELQVTDLGTLSQDSPFFPQESKKQDTNVLHFPSELPDLVSHNQFQFPENVSYKNLP